MEHRPPTKFDSIAKDYLEWSEKNKDSQIAYCVAQPDLANGISVAAMAIDVNGKIHPHQRRVGRDNLENFARLLVDFELEISRAKDFEELLVLLEKVKSERIGALVYYDTALRIGARLKLSPDRIYLHSGTKIGAQNLFGRKISKRYIYKSELPQDFLIYGFNEAQLEEILCQHKEKLSPNMSGC